MPRCHRDGRLAATKEAGLCSFAGCFAKEPATEIKWHAAFHIGEAEALTSDSMECRTPAGGAPALETPTAAVDGLFIRHGALRTSAIDRKMRGLREWIVAEKEQG